MRKFWSQSFTQFLSIFVHISGSIGPITLIWVLLVRSFPPGEVEYRWCQLSWPKQGSSRPVMAGTGVNGLRLVFTSDGVIVVVGVSQSSKRSHKLDGIGIRRIRTFPFLPIPFMTASLIIQWNYVGGAGSRSGRTSQSQGPESIIVIGFFHFRLRLRPCSFHWTIKDGVIGGPITVVLPTPSVWFSLDCITLRFCQRLRLRPWLRR